MKIRNAILALGLAIALSFNFTTTLSAASSIIPTIEEGITSVVDRLVLDRGSLVIQPGSIGVIGGTSTPAAPGAPVTLLAPANNPAPIPINVQISQNSNKVGLPAVHTNVKTSVIKLLKPKD